MSRKAMLLVTVVLVGFTLALVFSSLLTAPETTRAAQRMDSGPGAPVVPDTDAYIVLAWNDLGMHCYNSDFEYLAVLPPANTVWAQVLKVADPPQVVTTGLTVTYEVLSNTFSVGKTNFWDYEQDLYTETGDLLPNVGLTGNGLTGTMEAKADHFVAEMIPLTEILDDDYTANPDDPTPYPYQLVRVEVWDAATGQKLAEATPVAPVSSEMHCEYCHDNNGIGNRGISTGIVELNILSAHDREHFSDYPPGLKTLLVDSTPVRCSECHQSNATGHPGIEEVPNLSHAMHELHQYDPENCYDCHPGEQTQCLRGVMSHQYGMTCTDCHGGMEDVASEDRDPWLDEPRCDNDGCHPDHTYPADLLYRQATGHYGIYCEGCHDSPHAIAPSREANDQIKFIALQGTPDHLTTCTVCHASEPYGAGPHGTMVYASVYLPLVVR